MYDQGTQIQSGETAIFSNIMYTLSSLYMQTLHSLRVAENYIHTGAAKCLAEALMNNRVRSVISSTTIAWPRSSQSDTEPSRAIFQSSGCCRNETSGRSPENQSSKIIHTI